VNNIHGQIAHKNSRPVGSLKFVTVSRRQQLPPGVFDPLTPRPTDCSTHQNKLRRPKLHHPRTSCMEQSSCCTATTSAFGVWSHKRAI